MPGLGVNGPGTVFPRRLRAGDLAIIVVVIGGVHILSLAWSADPQSAAVRASALHSIVLGCVITGSWALLLAGAKTYREQILGHGASEYRRVVGATVAEFAGICLLLHLIEVPVPGGYFLVALCIGVVALVVWRCLARRRLVRARLRGRFTQPTFVVGPTGSVARTITDLERRPGLGLRVCGAFVSDDECARTERVRRVPVLGGVKGLRETIGASNGIAVVIARDSGLPLSAIRDLSWGLGPQSRLMMVAPRLDVVGSRQRQWSADGLTLAEVRRPRPDGVKRLIKRTMDLVLASVLCVLALPLWIVVPLLIWREDRGPVIFRQIRVGLDGKEFRIWKFRTMRVNADAELAGLLSEQGRSGKPLFKIDDDPRITRIGHFLRRSSIDELPQLFNVIGGSMSLVGPRPQVPKEVALYDETAARRLLVKPGLTGLWQVNGRSSLTWEEALRFDLFYVENWTPVMDLMILLKTVGVVLRREGSA